MCNVRHIIIVICISTKIKFPDPIYASTLLSRTKISFSRPSNGDKVPKVNTRIPWRVSIHSKLSTWSPVWISTAESVVHCRRSGCRARPWFSWRWNRAARDPPGTFVRRFLTKQRLFEHVTLAYGDTSGNRPATFHILRPWISLDNDRRERAPDTQQGRGFCTRLNVAGKNY